MDRKSLHVLVIEDNPDDMQLLRRYFQKTSFARLALQHCERLADGLKLLEEKNGQIDVILLDLGLPDSCGLHTFIKVHRHAPKIPIIVLSGQNDENLATQAVREGAQDYLVKGKFDGDLLVRSMRYSQERMRTEEALRLARDELETRVLERTSELARANTALNELIAEVVQAEEKVRNSLEGVIQVLSMIVEIRDPYTAGHQKSVADIAQAMARCMGLADERIEAVRLAATVHDLGKISIPSEILTKPAKLNELELSMIRLHPQAGYEILSKVDFPWPLAQIVLQHHERINGSGYPQGLAGADILLEAKIIGVADVVDAMCSHRPYRPAPGIDQALAEIRRHKGILYDTQVVDACLQHLGEESQGLRQSPKDFSIALPGAPKRGVLPGKETGYGREQRKGVLTA
ncbi:MAG: HD domain-containing phosphohydrolase [Thermodesulfobacteriota bacterium]